MVDKYLTPRQKRMRTDIPRTPDMKIVPKDRPYIPWRSSVGTQTPTGWLRFDYRHKVHEGIEGGVSSIGALAIVGAIVLAIGAYAYFTNKPQE